MQDDFYVERAIEQVQENAHRLVVKALFEEPTFKAID